MGSRIVDLKSITFCGRRLTRRRIAGIQRTVELFPSLSRDELASAICSHLGWRTPKGGESPGSCLRMLHVHVIRGLHAVFGIKRKTGADIDHFIPGDQEDVVMEIAPRKGTLATCGAHCLRLVKHLVGKTVFILGTTLLDSKQYTIPQLAERYRARWGVEEWYKVSKQRMEVEDFHGPSERGVQQKRYAGFPLNAMTRRFSGHGDHRWNESPHEHGKPRRQTHFKHGLAMVAADIESPVAEAGIRATGNGHPGGSRHHPMPTTTPARQILRTTIPKTREDVAAREKTASKNC